MELTVRTLLLLPSPYLQLGKGEICTFTKGSMSVADHKKIFDFRALS